MAYVYTPEVLEELAGHGLCPRPDTGPQALRDALRDLYKYEIKSLKGRLLAGEFPKHEYADRVTQLRRRYPLLSVPIALWVLPAGDGGRNVTPDQDGIRLRAAVPQFTVGDVVKTAEYYRDVLGFAIDGYFADPPVFAIVWRDHVEVFFNKSDGSEVKTGRARGAYDAYIRVESLDALADELRRRGADIIEGPVQRVYEQRELIVRDCNGLILAFGEATGGRGF